MRDHRINLPTLFLIAATRGMLGFGAGLLTAGRLSARHRRIAGLALVAAGIASTIPLALRVFRTRDDEAEDEMQIDGIVYAQATPVIIAEVLP